jgi:CRP-like cAMP-binding protein
MTHLASNLLLESLPSQERALLLAKCQAVPLPLNTLLYDVGEEPRYSYFITSGVASVVTAMKDGQIVEVGLLGREGVTGSTHLLGGQRGSTRCMIQIAGTGLRLDFRTLREEFHRQPGLLRRILEYVQYQSLMLSQLSACNRVHEVEERLARWLLMVTDRTGDDEMATTQEFLGQMLGSRRSTVTVVAGALQDAGHIEYRRGQITILNRKSLERAACECYPITRDLMNNVYKAPLSDR